MNSSKDMVDILNSNVLDGSHFHVFIEKRSFEIMSNVTAVAYSDTPEIS